jgi:hypothetical protein
MTANPARMSNKTIIIAASNRNLGGITVFPLLTESSVNNSLTGVIVAVGVSVKAGKIKVMAGKGTRVVVGVPAWVSSGVPAWVSSGVLACVASGVVDTPGEIDVVGCLCVAVFAVAVAGPGYGSCAKVGGKDMNIILQTKSNMTNPPLMILDPRLFMVYLRIYFSYCTKIISPGLFNPVTLIIIIP